LKEEFMTVTEAARKLGVSPRTIQRYCRQGRLNYKWVKGIRHKELRILPPISISQLPGGRKKLLSETFDYVTKSELAEIIAELRHKLDEKDNKITLLELETSQLKSLIGKTTDSPVSFSVGEHEDKRLKSAIETFLYEHEKIRPSERKLIIKMAKELEALKKTLKNT